MLGGNREKTIFFLRKSGISQKIKVAEKVLRKPKFAEKTLQLR